MQPAVLVSFLAPFLPHLLNLGKPVAEEAGKEIGKKLGNGTWERAKRIWVAIAKKLHKNHLAKGAVCALAEDSEDEDARDILANQLKMVLDNNSTLSRYLKEQMESYLEDFIEARSINQTVIGNGNILVEGSSNSITMY